MLAASDVSDVALDAATAGAARSRLDHANVIVDATGGLGILTRILALDRTRRLRDRHGVVGLYSMLALAILALCLALQLRVHLTPVLFSPALASALQGLWLGWILLGVLTGRDLTSHLQVHRLAALPVTLPVVYVVDAVNAFVSAPLLLVLVLVSGLMPAASRVAGMPVVFLGLLAFTTAVRATVSVARTGILRNAALSLSVRLSLVTGAALVFAMPWIEPFPGSAVRFSPPSLLFRVGSSGDLGALGQLVLVALALSLADYSIQREVLRSGMLSRPGARATSRGASLLERACASSAQRLAVVALLRNPSALMLLVWGCAYGCVYPLWSGMTGAGGHMGFVCMALLFHAYLRGNLLGLDGGAAAHFFLIEGSIERAIRTRNNALTAVQLAMVAAVLLPAALRPGRVLGSPLGWAAVLGSTCAALIVAEIVGTATSLLYPERIDRRSIYSGGFTLGAIAVPAAQVVVFLTFAIVLLLVQNERIPSGAGWTWCVAVPSISLVARRTLMGRLSWRLGDRRREHLIRALGSVVP